MTTYDWLVVGGGFTGAALAYELRKQGFTVLLLEKDATLHNSTRYSYGGIPYWSGNSPLTNQLCEEGIEYHRHLSEELAADTEFREVDLILTIDKRDNPESVAANCSKLAIKPRLLGVESACQLEPLLNPQAISGVLQLPHGHIHPLKTTFAYHQALCRAGGEMGIGEVVELVRKGTRVEGVRTKESTYSAANTVICAGGLSRALLKNSGITIPLYFTQAQIIVTPPVDLKFRTLVMPAVQQRFSLEGEGGELESLWDEPGREIVPAILDTGAIQFRDGHLRLGQISQVITDVNARMDPAVSERRIREGVGRILPAVANLPGTWHNCVVAFGKNSSPLVGAISNELGIYIFSGFNSTLLFSPPLARHFANWAATGEDEIISSLDNW